nr:MAG TPA: hypothetical protein [Caudoviricetes sp.]
MKKLVLFNCGRKITNITFNILLSFEFLIFASN